MREEVQLVKKSKVVRKPNVEIESVDAYSRIIPKEIRDMVDGQEMKIKKFYYNGGLDLVNYALNTFVKELYVIYKCDNPVMCFCSDRFNNYYKILDKEIVTLIHFSQLCISPEGILIFYTQSKMYVTLNCKVGCIIEFSDIIDTNNMKDVEIVMLEGNTFIKVIYKKRGSETYYRLDFSFNFFASYGPQIGINVLDSNHKGTNETIVKSNNLKLLSIGSKYIPYKVLKNEFPSLLCNENLTVKYSNCWANAYELWHFGDTKIDDCINSFVHKICFMDVIKEKKVNIFKTKKVIKHAVISVDRSGQKCINDELHEFFDNVNSKFFVSTEGVIMRIVSKYHMFISLDGILWKHIDLVSILGIGDYYSGINFTCKNGNNYIIVVLSSTEKIEKRYLLKFSFNFIDLYESPVEVSFEEVECVDEMDV